MEFNARADLVGDSLQGLEDHSEAMERLSIVWSATNIGSSPIPIRIECAQGRGFSGISMIGGVGQVCEDGKERARTALESLGWSAPARKVLISVSPGDAKVDKTHLDLALSVALAGIDGCRKWKIVTADWMFAAEVGLSGELRPVAGVVGWASAALGQGLKGLVVAKDNLAELDCLRSVGWADDQDFRCLGFESLAQVLTWLESASDVESLATASITSNPQEDVEILPNFDDMELSPEMELLAAVVASGGHSLLMRGSPGTGKSMLARRIPSILPKMSVDHHLHALKIHSAITPNVPSSIIRGYPPYRCPHHFTSLPAMVGSIKGPGEMSLASGGVLFLDELPEFRRDVLEGLREPLESREVAVSRAGGRHTWSADVLLIAAANNCPCGWSSSRRRRCECPTSKVNAYRARLSGPLQDRIDIHVNMEEPSNQVAALLSQKINRSGQTKKIREKVITARQKALLRRSICGVEINRDIPVQHVTACFMLPELEALNLVTKVMPKHVSARSLIRCLRVARTIADIRARDVVTSEDVEQAWTWQSWSAAKLRGEVLPI